MFKDYKFYLIVAGILFGIYFFFIKPNMALNELKKQNEILKKEIIAKDTLQKLADGKYSKLVNTYNSASDLNKILRDSMKLVSDSISKRKERVLFVDQNNITFKNKTGKSVAVANSDSTYSFSSYYPDKTNFFIQHDGILNTKTKSVADAWKFSNVNLNVVVTERKDGLWDSYIDGPDFLKVNSVKVNSLPAEKYVPKSEQPKSLVFYGGLGLRGNPDVIITNKDLLIKGAITYKDKYMIQADYGTDKKVGLGVLVSF